jgi:acetyl esterase/lipase
MTRSIVDPMVTHPLDPADASIMSSIRAATKPVKGLARGIEARASFDELMAGVPARSDVTFEADTIGGVSGLWVRPAQSRTSTAILHLHGGWFNLGSATAYRHLVGQIVARAGANAFVPDYRLAPEHPFPAAPEDVLACYRGLEKVAPRIAITGDSAGGNLALGLASRVTAVAVAVMSPVTDLSLSGQTYETPTRSSRASRWRRWSTPTQAAPTRGIRWPPRCLRNSPAYRPYVSTSETMRCCWTIHAATSTGRSRPAWTLGSTSGWECPTASWPTSA